MDHVQRLDPGLQVVRERFIGQHHIGEAGASSHGIVGHHFDAIQQRGVCGHIAIGAVGMPQRIDLLEDHAMVGLGKVLALCRHIGHVVDGRCGDGLVLLRKIFQRAPLLGEGNLLLLAQVLVPKAQHTVCIQCIAKFPDLLRIQGQGKVDSCDFGAQHRVELRDHGSRDDFSLFHISSGWTGGRSARLLP
jgi:hypothetical protein